MATKKAKKKATTKKKAKAAPKARGAASRKKTRSTARQSRRRIQGASAKRKVAAKKKSLPKKSLPKKSPPKKSPPMKAGRSRTSRTAGAAPKPMRREDRAGHFDPRYEAMLREQSGPKEHDPPAFLDVPRSPLDDLAEERGEEVVEKATSGEDEAGDALDQVVPEEQGGPFVETNAAQEFAHGTDPSNPKGAKREPFPRT